MTIQSISYILFLIRWCQLKQHIYVYICFGNVDSEEKKLKSVREETYQCKLNLWHLVITLWSSNQFYSAWFGDVEKVSITNVCICHNKWILIYVYKKKNWIWRAINLNSALNSWYGTIQDDSLDYRQDWRLSLDCLQLHSLTNSNYFLLEPKSCFANCKWPAFNIVLSVQKIHTFTL